MIPGPRFLSVGMMMNSIEYFSSFNVDVSDWYKFVYFDVIESNCFFFLMFFLSNRVHIACCTSSHAPTCLPPAAPLYNTCYYRAMSAIRVERTVRTVNTPNTRQGRERERVRCLRLPYDACSRSPLGGSAAAGRGGDDAGRLNPRQPQHAATDQIQHSYSTKT